MIGGNVIICDDVREEITRKMTYVGAYRNAIITENPLPAALAKLVLVIFWNQTLDEELLPVDIELYLPESKQGEPSAKATLDPSQVAIGVSDLPSNERQLIMELQFVLAPLELKQAGDIRVQAVRAGKRLSLRKLQVREKTPEERDAGA